jgi:hypothetical protein
MIGCAKRLQWMAGFRLSCTLDALGPPPLKRIVDMAHSLSSGQ